MDKEKSKNVNGKKSNKEKKKYRLIKRYALCFPFHIDIKIINEQNLILNLITQLKLENFFSAKLKTLFFGLNTSLNFIQNDNEEEKMIFIFYKKNMENLFDLILFRTKNNKNICIYFIDESYNKKFVEIFKIKKLLSFLLVKKNFNETQFNNIKKNLENYDINKENNKIIKNNNIQETIIEK